MELKEVWCESVCGGEGGCSVCEGVVVEGNGRRGVCVVEGKRCGVCQAERGEDRQLDTDRILIQINTDRLADTAIRPKAVEEMLLVVHDYVDGGVVVVIVLVAGDGRFW